MKKFSRAFSAYVIATLAVIPVAWVAADWLHAVGLIRDIEPGLVIAPLWLLVVGAPSMAAAANHVARVLGKRSIPWVRGTSARSIPIGAGPIGDAVGHILPWVVPSKSAAIDVADEVLFGMDDVIITEREMRDFLNRAWSRQCRGRSPLSRTWWVENGRRLDRAEYETIVAVLVSHDLIKRRAPGASGRLRYPPTKIMTELHHLYG